MFQLRETILEKRILRADQLESVVGRVFKHDGGGLILEAGHFEGFHHDFVLICRGMRLAVRVQAYYFDGSGLTIILEFVLDRDGRACPQFLDVLTCLFGLTVALLV